MEPLVSIFPFLADGCKALVSCKCVSLQMHFSAGPGAGGQCRSCGLPGDLCPLSAPVLRRWFEDAGGTAGLGDVPSGTVLCGVLRRSRAARAPDPW